MEKNKFERGVKLENKAILYLDIMGEEWKHDIGLYRKYTWYYCMPLQVRNKDINFITEDKPEYDWAEKQDDKDTGFCVNKGVDMFLNEKGGLADE